MQDCFSLYIFIPDSENDASTSAVEERPREQSCNVASSLPMSIPAFSRFSRSFVEDDDDEKAS